MRFDDTASARILAMTFLKDYSGYGVNLIEPFLEKIFFGVVAERVIYANF